MVNVVVALSIIIFEESLFGDINIRSSDEPCDNEDLLIQFTMKMDIKISIFMGGITGPCFLERHTF